MVVKKNMISEIVNGSTKHDSFGHIDEKLLKD